MKTTKITSLLLFTLFFSYMLFLVFNFKNLSEKSQSHADPETLRTRIFFEPNMGQASDDVKFISNGHGYSLFLSQNEARLAFNIPDKSNNSTSSFIKMKLEGAQEPTRVYGHNKMTGKTNYLIGNDKDKWLTDIPNYAEVKYEDIYPGIDLIYYGNEGVLQYDFIVSPEGNPNNIMVEFESEETPKIDKNGNLIFKIRNTEIKIKAPFAYQIKNNEQRIVDANFLIQENGSIGFDLGHYNKDLSLIIDPKIIFSTYLGNNSWADATDIDLDSAENIYITGTTNSYTFPVTDSSLTPGSYGVPVIFVTKMNSDGTEILYSTYFGGTNDDTPHGIAVDREGNILVAGYTLSNDLPVVNAFQSHFRGEGVLAGDGFISKIDPEGNKLVYSTYIGGEWDDKINDIAVDTKGNAFITGYHDSENFPYKNPISVFECGEYSDGGFIAKISSSGGLEFATCLGNSTGFGITTDQADNVYVTGHAYSGFYTTSGAYQTTASGPFVLKMNNSGSSVIYSTFISGNQFHGIHKGHAIAVDTIGNAYITGTTSDPNFPMVNAFQPSRSNPSSHNQEGFVSKLSPDGSSLLFSSFIGGDDHDYGVDIDVDDNGGIYIIGGTASDNMPVVEAFQQSLSGNRDAFVAKIDGNTFSLDFASYLGGSGGESGSEDQYKGLKVSNQRYVYVAGPTSSTDFPTENAYQETSESGDAFVVKFIVDPKGVLNVKPNRLIFPYTGSGNSTKKPVELSNSGAGLLELKNITVQPSDVYALEGAPTLPYRLEPEQNIEFQVVYSPKALKSTKNALDEGEARLRIETDGEEPITDVPFIEAIIINDTTDASDVPDDDVCDIDLTKTGYQVTLRAAIEFINSLENGEITNVTFEVPIEGTPVIRPKSALDPIEYPISFDASTQLSGYVVVDGSKAGSDIEGFVIKAGLSKLKNLTIKNFGANGIRLCENDSTIIDNCEITGNGTTASDRNNANGLLIFNSSKNRIINNVFSENKRHGILLSGTEITEKNVIENNKIGTSILGLFQFPNGRNGVAIKTNVSKTTIKDNIISGNDGYGISVINTNKFYEEYEKTKKNIITNNIIGMNIFGSDTVPNKNGGILLSGIGVEWNTISANIIAANGLDGIGIKNNSSNNYVVGNMIGFYLEDNTRIGNGGHGILLDRVQDNTIDTNIVINNGGFGICIFNESPRVNTIKYNNIGRLSKNYSQDLPHNNFWGGVLVEKGAPLISDNNIYHHDTSGIHIINGNATVQFNRISHNKTGIEIITDNDNFNTVHKNDIVGNGTGLRIAGIEYPNEYKSNHLKSKNGFRFLGTKLANNDGSYNTIINGNFIYNNTNDNTGIHINDAPVFICGNDISFNDGNAITVEGEENVTVKLNNILSNLEYGLENVNPASMINATNNFWGDSTGPAGSGPGVGDKVSEGVDFSDWKTDWISVYAAAQNDTFAAVIGQTDSVMLVFDNWARVSDTLNVTLSDELGWIQAHNPRQVRTPYYPDDVATLFFTIPETTDNNTFNQVNIKAISQAVPGDSMVSTFHIHAQKPILRYLLLFPDTIELETSSSIQFSTYGYDQANHLMDFTANWSCTGGTIDGNGLFNAANESGTFRVFVQDATSGLSDTAIILLSHATQVDAETLSAVRKKQILQSYPNPFNTSVTIRYELEAPGYVTINVYNLIGQEIAKLVDGYFLTGDYEIDWQPVGLESGTYIGEIIISGAKRKKPDYYDIHKLLYIK